MHIWWETGNEFERCCKRELLTEVSLKVQKLDFLAVSEKKTNSYWIKLLKGQWAVEIFFFDSRTFLFIELEVTLDNILM